MSKLEQNTTSLDEVLAMVNALPDAGGGGGGGAVETCTVTAFVSSSATATNTGNPAQDAFFTAFEDGAINAKYLSDGSTTFGNVVKNSAMYFEHALDSTKTIVCENAELLDTVTAGTAAARSFFKITGNATINFVYATKPCFVKGTKIVLADETTKPVEGITYEDVLLVWDFDNGCYAYAKPIWIMKQQVTSSYYRCTFSDGTVLNLVGSNGKCHRVYNADDSRFDYATDCVGKNVYTMVGIVKLVSCEIVEETVEFYNVITENHVNLFAEGVLTSCRLNNLYDIRNMKFVKDGRTVIPREAYENVDERIYRGLRLGEQKAEDVPMLNEYLANMMTLALTRAKEVNT